MLGTTWRMTHWKYVIWSYYIFLIIRRPGFMIITSSFSSFSVVFSYLLWMLDLWSSFQTVFVETVSSWWILSSAVTFAAVVLWFLDTILFNIWQSLSISFGCDHYSSQLMVSSYDLCMPSQCWERPLWIHLTKRPFWLQMLQLNAHQQSAPYENLTSLPFCSTFIWTVIKHKL